MKLHIHKPHVSLEFLYIT